jgi:hypothetical protein
MPTFRYTNPVIRDPALAFRGWKVFHQRPYVGGTERVF